MLNHLELMLYKHPCTFCCFMFANNQTKSELEDENKTNSVFMYYVL